MSNKYAKDAGFRDATYSALSSIGNAFQGQANADLAGADAFLKSYGKQGLNLKPQMSYLDKLKRNEIVDNNRKIQSKLYNALTKQYLEKINNKK